MRKLDIGRGTVSRELARLVSAGILCLSREGNLTYYQANSNSPVFNELRSIIKKSFGIVDLLKQALVPVEHKIITAFIYGSVSKSRETAESDIDLMLIGPDLEYSDVMNLLLPVEESIGRTINPTLYSVEDFYTRRKERNSFITRVIKQPRILIKGLIDDIGKPAQDREDT
jgi:predicted nucleotidyltransferase